MRIKYLFVATVLVLAGTVYEAQDQKEPAQNPPPAAVQTPPAVPHGFNISPEEAARKNPLRFSEISVERGKKVYQTQCAMCHGEKGEGKGELAEEMKITPPDFTKPETLEKRTDGELFAIIHLGSAEMPGQGTRMNETHKWEIVNYLRSLSGKTPMKSTDEELQQGTVVVTEPAKEKEKEKGKPPKKDRN